MTAEQFHSGAVSTGLVEAAASVRAYLAELSQTTRTASSADLLAEVAELETLRRQLAAADHLLLPEIESRGLAPSHGCATVAALLRHMLRLSPREANARVRAAAALGPRRGLTGQPMEPILPTAAEAAHAGDVSPEHVDLLCRAMDDLPAALPVDQFHAAEQILTRAACELDPPGLIAASQRLQATINPDGTRPTEYDARRRRSLTLGPQRDGMVTGTFCLDPEAGAKAIAVLHAHSAPLPAADGSPDPRSHQQRMADAFEDLCDLALRAGRITSDGPAVTLTLTMSQEQYDANRGLAETTYGQLLSVDSALELSRQASLAVIVSAAKYAVLDLGLTARLASRQQRIALTVRDRGCSFPGCTKPAEWTQAHHIQPWWAGGRTDLANLTLVCRYHHREFARRGWDCVMIDGLPWWRPPASRDPNRTLQQNHRIQLRT